MRRLIVCADGTWNEPAEDDHGVPAPTNVVKMRRAIRPVGAGNISQVVYYNMGVGTAGGFDKLLGGAFGEGIDRHILDCYEFLVDNYQAGDEIYFFGFSRGAYCVRSLAGLVRNSGILKQAHAGMADEAFSLYRDHDPAKHPGSDSAQAFRQAFSNEADILCIGVWDTVGALGVPLGLFNQLNHARFSFHDTSLSSHVKNAFHALAIDERRGPFSPTLWVQKPEDMHANNNWLEQAWFAGVHSNIGGGYAEAGLSDIALCWMIDRVRTKVAERNDNSVLDFDDMLIEQMTRPDPTARVYDSMSGLFKELGEHERPIDDPPGHAPDLNEALGGYTWEYVHSSVRQRYETKGFVEPIVRKNLAEYAKRTNPKPRFGAQLQAPWPYEDMLPDVGAGGQPGAGSGA